MAGNKSKPADKARARTLYVKDGQSPAEIAIALGIAPTTVYNWRREDEGKTQDWDKCRSAYSLSPKEMLSQYAQQVRELLLDLAENPEKMANANTADALAKHISNLQKLNPKHLYMGALIDLIKATDDYLSQYDEVIRQRMAAHWPGIREQIRLLLEQELPLG